MLHIFMELGFENKQWQMGMLQCFSFLRDNETFTAFHSRILAVFYFRSKIKLYKQTQFASMQRCSSNFIGWRTQSKKSSKYTLKQIDRISSSDFIFLAWSAVICVLFSTSIVIWMFSNYNIPVRWLKTSSVLSGRNWPIWKVVSAIFILRQPKKDFYY